MPDFTIDDISETWEAIPDSTFGVYYVALPDRGEAGRAITNITDIQHNDEWREHVASFLNKLSEEEGADAVLEALASGDGLRIPPPPI